ncbi:histidine kinase [Streptomyces sp. SP17BM10]|uniref:sensor histidine kinase n=1 Tax=Streptomyces sp. SP17BM10 TaxID=3002530 RepID=UPI002E7945A8|nr:histidine kinase [Streptomyces sp. SP17BM10]MEE1788764.1 histidine kinase [Streptomyces sp. SP17BM10]
MTDQGPEPGSHRWAYGWRRIMLATGMLVYPALTALGVSHTVAGAWAVAGHAVVAAFTVCYAAGGIAFARGRRRQAELLTAGQAALFVAAMPFAHADAFFLGTGVVSFVAVLFPARATAAVAAGTVGALLLPWAVRPWHAGPGWFQALALLFSTLTVRGFSEIATTNQELVAARAEVARLASEAERNRIARDLHDLLGHSLTAITVKSRLAQRLAAKDLALAVEEMAAVEDLSRQALADVRAAVSGYREVTLAAELARGRELLRAAGVVADLPGATDAVAPAHRELFGWVVREGLTNVVRHARAERCAVLLTGTSVEIRDDGPGKGGGAGPGDGKGLAGLRERVAAADGSVEAGPLGQRGWRLRVTVPAVPGRPHAPAGEGSR